MAIGIVMDVPGGTKAMYDKTMENLGLTAEGGDWPEGIISHTAGPSGRDWIVVDTWESREDFDKFLKERLMQATKDTGFPPLQPKFFDIYLSHQT